MRLQDSQVEPSMSAVRSLKLTILSTTLTLYARRTKRRQQLKYDVRIEDRPFLSGTIWRLGKEWVSTVDGGSRHYLTRRAALTEMVRLGTAPQGLGHSSAAAAPKRSIREPLERSTRRPSGRAQKQRWYPTQPIPPNVESLREERLELARRERPPLPPPRSIRPVAGGGRFESSRRRH